MMLIYFGHNEFVFIAWRVVIYNRLKKNEMRRRRLSVRKR